MGINFDSLEFKAYHASKEAERNQSEIYMLIQTHNHKGYSEEKCIRCGWVMGNPALNCNNDDAPHVFPSQIERLM